MQSKNRTKFQPEILYTWNAPWQWDRNFGYLRNYDGDVLASFPHGATTSDKSDHDNARLAAKAPELLAELTILVGRCEKLPALCPDQAGTVHRIADEAKSLLKSISKGE